MLDMDGHGEYSVGASALQHLGPRKVEPAWRYGQKYEGDGMNTFVVCFTGDRALRQISRPVMEGVYSGRCMDTIYVSMKPVSQEITRIALRGVQAVCALDSFQELVFDLLANAPNTVWLSAEKECVEDDTAAMLLMILRQFHEAYPERSVCLEKHEAPPEGDAVLLCDLAA